MYDARVLIDSVDMVFRIEVIFVCLIPHGLVVGGRW
jgi:hypothetical protein